MRVQSGKARNARRAKNFIKEQAQARLNETLPTFQNQVHNALAVDAVKIEYYRAVNNIGVPCTCSAIAMSDEELDDSAVDPVIAMSTEQKTTLKLKESSLFGTGVSKDIYNQDKGIDVSYNERIPDVFDENPREANVEYQQNPAETGANCGICYRTKKVYGYQRLGTQRTILATHNIAALDGASIVRSAAPNEIMVVEDGFVRYMIQVPMYFTSVAYSVRNNTTILKGQVLYYEGSPLTVELLRRYAGQVMPIEIRCKRYTHAVIEFDPFTNVLGNLSAETDMISYDQRDTTQVFTVVLPPSIHEVRVKDILVIRERRLVLRVTDRERKVTADLGQIEWVVQARVLQPSEALKNIHKNFLIG